MKKFLFLFVSVFFAFSLLSCEPSFESQIEKIWKSSGSDYAKLTAQAIVYSKYDKPLPAEYTETLYQNVYDKLDKCNFWKTKSYDELYSKLNNGFFQTMDDYIVLGLLNYEFDKKVESAPFVQDVIDVLIECKIK